MLERIMKGTSPLFRVSKFGIKRNVNCSKVYGSYKNFHTYDNVT